VDWLLLVVSNNDIKDDELRAGLESGGGRGALCKSGLEAHGG
jgi:hypothetical protein